MRSNCSNSATCLILEVSETILKEMVQILVGQICKPMKYGATQAINKQMTENMHLNALILLALDADDYNI